MANNSTGYELSRNWFNWCFENPEKIKPNHTALYFFIIEHCNRLGWKEKFGLPTTMAKEAIGISSYNTFINTFNDLIDWGFIIIIEKSKNQYSSNIIAISNIDKSPNKALDKALIKHDVKQSESTVQSIDSVDKQETKNKEQETINNIYCLYPSICPTKKSSTGKSSKNKDKIKTLLKTKTSEELISMINRYVKECTASKIYMKNFSTFLNNLPDYSEIKPSQVEIKSKFIHYRLNGFEKTHHEKAYLENLQSLGPDKVQFLNYVEDGN